MTKANRTSVTIIWNETNMWKSHTITAATITVSPTKKSRKKKIIEATTVIGGVMIIDVLPTIAVERLDLGTKHEINVVTKKVPRMNGAKSLAGNIASILVTIDDFSKHRKSNMGKPPQLQ